MRSKLSFPTPILPPKGVGAVVMARRLPDLVISDLVSNPVRQPGPLDMKGKLPVSFIYIVATTISDIVFKSCFYFFGCACARVRNFEGRAFHIHYLHRKITPGIDHKQAPDIFSIRIRYRAIICLGGNRNEIPDSNYWRIFLDHIAAPSSIVEWNPIRRIVIISY